MTLINKEPSSPINQEYRLKELKDILKYAIDNKVSIHQALKHKGRGKNFFSENYIKFNNDNDLLKYKKEYDNLNLNIANKFGNSFSIENKTNVKKTVDLNDDIKYDKRSTWWANRDENGKIIDYEFKIMVRDEKDFCGTLSRSEMDSIYSQYPYTTQNNCSQLFPRFTFIEFKRLILCFQISKNKLLSLHSIEEESEEKLVELALKAKENAVYKKFITDKPIFIEKQLREVQKELVELREDRLWVENLVEKYFNERVVGEKSYNNLIKQYDFNKKTLFIFFGDIHFGKNFMLSAYNRGTNKVILRERVLQIANDTINEFNSGKYNDIVLINTGDILESATTTMHPDHILEMDLLGEKQVSYAIDTLEEMLELILNNVSGSIKMYNIPGNHDRIGQNRNDDKKRTAGGIVYSVLKKLYSKTPNNRIEIENPEDGIISTEKDKISIIAHHGDATLSKRKPLEILNIWKKGDTSNYSIILQGHWHQYKVEEGPNYTSLGIGSVCSADNYIQNELGLGTQPSYVMGHRNDKYGFDFKKITLY